MTFEEIINNSTVSIYSKNNRLGYQRSLVERHLKKIVVSLKTDSTPISPTSILLGIDEENLIQEDESSRKSSRDAGYIKLKKNEGNNTFRIIDGQHRIMAMNRYIQELSDKDDKDTDKINKLNSYEFSVIIMPINSNKKIKEVEVFQSINAKAKPLKTDLVKLALTRYEELERVKDLDYTNHLAKRIIFSLNDDKLYKEDESKEDESLMDSNSKINVWKNGIIIDVNNDDEIGIIGYNAFYKSLELLCKIYTTDIQDELKGISYEDLDKYLNVLSNKITYELIIPCWKIIMDKWENCFSYKKLSFDDEIYYDDSYYIQKNMGLRSLHNILTTIVKKNNDNKEDFSKIINEFETIIISSKLISEDWEKGGRFKGLSSEAGFKHIESIIKQ